MRNAQRTEGDLSIGDRLIEIIAVVLLGITTLGTAWCGFQAAQWSARSGDFARVASQQHVESARLYGIATQKVSYDSLMVAQYATASSEGNTRLLQFFRATLIRPDFLPVLDRWEATVRAGGTPTGLTEDPDYLASQLGDYQAAVEAAGTSTVASDAAGRNSAQYVVTTILLAAALFFAGVTSSFRYRPARILLVVAAMGTLALAASRLATLPIA